VGVVANVLLGRRRPRHADSKGVVLSLHVVRADDAGAVVCASCREVTVGSVLDCRGVVGGGVSTTKKESFSFVLVRYLSIYGCTLPFTATEPAVARRGRV
jgi:hypothetical protein